MSYILEALKKSDQKRKQGNVPGLQTIHVPLSVESQQSRWPYVVIILLLMGLVFLLGLMRPWQVAIITEPVVEADQQSPVKAVAANSIVARSVDTKMIADRKKIITAVEQPVMVESSVKHQPQMIEKIELSEESLPHLQEMPELIQQAIPDMSFAGHVYSSNPAQRSVIINGSVMGEGDIIMDGLKIEQITHNGVVFDYRMQRFRIDILQDWSFD